MDAISDPEVIVIAMLMLFVPGIIIGSNGLSANNSGKRTLILWRIEAKLDLLLKQANLSFDPYQSLPAGGHRGPATWRKDSSDKILPRGHRRRLEGSEGFRRRSPTTGTHA
jgi:hypothetical protein